MLAMSLYGFFAARRRRRARERAVEFGWTEEQLQYRNRVTSFLADALPPDWSERAQGYGSRSQIEFSRTFCPRLAEAGLLAPHWPVAHGGQGQDAWHQFILAEEMKAAEEPRGPQYMNVNWIGPVLMKYGSPDQQAEHLPRIAQGAAIWCQGYSEPAAGTDLAALQTRATREGDDYVINGSKIWTSYSYMADWCFLLARTGSGRKEISILLVPMSTAGIHVAPFPGLTQEGHLNEVFFDNVRVPAAALLGEEGKAWDIITYALSYERVGIPRYHLGQRVLGQAVQQLKDEGRYSSAAAMAAGKIMALFESARMLTYVVVDQRARGLSPSVDANISRVASAEAVTALSSFLMDYTPDCLLGGDHDLGSFYRANVSSTIAAGAYEIQLNLIARQALGLNPER